MHDNTHRRFTARNFGGWRSEDTWGVVAVASHLGAFIMLGMVALVR